MQRCTIFSTCLVTSRQGQPPQALFEARFGPMFCHHTTRVKGKGKDLVCKPQDNFAIYGYAFVNFVNHEGASKAGISSLYMQVPIRRIGDRSSIRIWFVVGELRNPKSLELHKTGCSFSVFFWMRKRHKTAGRGGKPWLSWWIGFRKPTMRRSEPPNPRLNKHLQTNITALHPSHPFETVQALELFNGFVDWQSLVPWWQAKKPSQRLFGGKFQAKDEGWFFSLIYLGLSDFSKPHGRRLFGNDKTDRCKFSKLMQLRTQMSFHVRHGQDV